MAVTSTGTNGFYYEYVTANATTVIDSNADARALIFDGTGQATRSDGHVNYVSILSPGVDDFAVRYTGTFNVSPAKVGDWDFQIAADDGIILIIDGVEINSRFDESDPGSVPGGWNDTSTVNLSAGTHTIEVIYWERSGGESVSLLAQAPDEVSMTAFGADDGVAGATITNDAPDFGTVASPISVAEGETGVVFDAQATDDGGAADAGITYSFDGGVDDGKFTIDSSTGEVSFSAAPDFENPTDDGANNTYAISVRATDAEGAFTSQAVQFNVTNVAPVGTVTADGDGLFAEGETITFTVTFDEVVTENLSALTLTGPRSATYDSGSGTNTLTYTYTVGASDDEADLEVTGYTGDITDDGGAPAVLVATSDLDIVLDTTAPATPGVPDLLATSDSNINNDDTTNDTTPTFSVDVSGLSAGEFVTLIDQNAGGATISAAYEVTGTETDGLAEITANILTDAVYSVAALPTDAAGNIGTASAGLPVTIDTDADVGDDLSIAFVNAGSDQVYGGTETVAISVSGLDTNTAAELTITGTAGDVVKAVSGNGTVTLNTAESVSLGDGALSAAIVATDTAGNTTSPAPINSFSADYTAPTVVSAAISGGTGVDGTILDADTGGTVELTITFSEEMDTATDPSIAIFTAGTGLTESATVARSWSVDGTALTLTYDVADTDVDLADIEVTVTDAADAAGNVLSMGSPITTETAIDTDTSAAQTATVAFDEIPDQAQATAGAIDLVTLDGTDGTTYALSGMGEINTHVEFDGLTLRISDNEAARAFFDREENPSIVIEVAGTDNAGNITLSTLTFNLNDLNDAPELGAGPNTDADTVKERADGAGENAVPFGTDGTFTVTDDDTGNTHSVTVSNISTTGSGGFLGFFSAGFDDPITGDGAGTVAWNFNVGAPLPAGVSAAQMATIDALAEGETIVQTYDVIVTETNTSPAQSFTQRVTITIEGTNDLPVISGTEIGASVTEVVDPSMADQTLTAEGTLSVADTDATDTVVVEVTSVATSGTFTGTNPLEGTDLLGFMQVVAGDGTSGTPGTATDAMAAAESAPSDFTWKFSAGITATSAFDFLNEGETLELAYTLTATDSSTAAGVDTQVVTITVTGSNDVPTIAAASTVGGVVEAGDGIPGTSNATGSLNVSGMNWVDADDGETADLLITKGSAGSDAQSNLTFDSGMLSNEAAIEGTYGTLYVTATGDYRYELNDLDADTQALDGGDLTSETFNYTIANRTGGAENEATQTLTVNITGSNDAPEITVVEAVGTVVEAGVDSENAASAGTPSATGSFTASDVDADDTDLTWSANVSGMQIIGMGGEIIGTYGTFSVDASGAWTFTLANESPAVDALYQGESVSETFEVEVADGNGGTDTETVTINITGTNDAPVVTADALPDTDVTEIGDGVAGDASASGSFTVTDVDSDAPTTDDDAKIWSIVDGDTGALTTANPATSAQVIGTYGTLTLTNMGAWTYTLGDSFAATQALDDSGSVNDVFTVRVADGLGGFDEIDVTVTVAGSNDAPTITVETGDGITGAVTEGSGTLTASDTLTISDVDGNETVTTTVTGVTASGVLGEFGAIDDATLQALVEIANGTLTNDASGNGSNQATWNFSAESTLFDYLAKDEVLTLAYEITSDDTTTTDTQTVTVTVTGSNDLPSVQIGAGDSDTGAVTESDMLVMGNLETNGTLTISDRDASDTHTPNAYLDTVTWTDLNGTNNGGTPSSAGTISNPALLAALENAFSVDNSTDNDTIEWTYSLADTQVDFLGAGETLTLVFYVSAQDDSASGGGDINNQPDTSPVRPVTITITGSDDAPTITADTQNSFDEGDSLVIEDGAATGPSLADDVTVNLLGTGVDTTSEIWVTNVDEELDTNDTRSTTGTPSISVGGSLPAGYAAADVEAAFGGLTSDSDVVTFNRNAAVFDALDDGAFIDVTLSYTVRTTSPDGTTFVDTPLTTVVRVNGVNDAPYIVNTEDFEADITEDGTTSLNGAITFNDIEPTDTAALSVTVTAVEGTGDGAASLADYVGTFSAGSLAPSGGSDGSVFYSFNISNAVLQNLAEGEVFTQSYEVAITDGDLETSRPIVITFTGVNDAPANVVVSGTTAVTEDLDTDATAAATTQQLTGSISFDDADVSTLAAGDPAITADTHTVTSAFASATLDGDALVGYSGATGTFAIDAASVVAANMAQTVANSVDWTYDINDADFDFLADGEALALTFTVTIDDGNTDGVTTQDVTFTVTGTNDSPTLGLTGMGDSNADTLAETDAGLTASGTLTLSDVDLSDTVSVNGISVAVTSGSAGTLDNATLQAMLSVAGDLDATETSEQVTWTFDSGMEAFDYLTATQSLELTYTLTATDSAGATDTQNVVITINGTNDVPTIAGTATGTVAEDAMDLTASGQITIADPDTGESTFGAIAAGTAGDNAYGTFEVDTAGNWTYTLNNALDVVQDLGVGQSIDDTITVASFDGTASQVLTVTITGTNDAPVIDEVATDNAPTTDEDVPFTGTVVAADRDGDTLTYAVGTDAANGSVTINETSGEYTYTPDANTNGPDSFIINVTDGQGGLDAITINIGVTAVDDAPDAAAGTDTTAEDTAVIIDVTPFVTEVDGETYSVTAASVPAAQGTVTFSGTSITFTPALNFNGNAEIAYTVTDDAGTLSDSDTVTVTVTAVDDAPVAADDTQTVLEDAATTDFDVASLITEVDGDAVIVSATVPAAEGTVTVTGTVISFTPAANFNGLATISYTVTDDTGAARSDNGVIAVTVTPVNDATEIDVAAQVTPTHVEAVDAAPAVPTLVADAVTLVDVDGLDYDGAVFTAAVDSGDASDLLSLDNAGSVAVTGSTVSVGGTDVGTLSSGTGTLSVAFAGLVSEAQVQAVVQALAYATTSDQPAASRAITLDLTDGDGGTAMQQSVSLDISASNDTPTPTDDIFIVGEGSFLSTGNVLTAGTADSDPDGDSLTVSALADVKDDTGTADASGNALVGASAGVITTDWGAEVTLQSNGSLFYNLTSNTARFNQLAAGQSAIDSFTYTVTDGVLTETATVSVTIIGTNDNIKAVADTITATEDTAASVSGNLLANDTDVDVGDTREIINVTSSVTATAIATATGYQITTVDGVVITLGQDGSYALTAPDTLDEGTLYTATFQYSVQDGGSAQSTTTVTVNVTGNNDGPAAATVTLTASDEDTTRVITEAELLAGASDPDANAVLEITDLSLTSGNGSLDDNGDGTWTYTPELNDNSAVTFSYTVSDGALTATASADLDLLPVNDAPEVAAALTATATEDDAG
ncbi:VCBS domain-containing protein, partial [Pseudosulfitobacter sp. DSM 107133]|uniref:VCBS domain-containing protein n=1 Tax=Pseudosulfitobacter sp. DSM 107133 TaxID=2883100 RepID=UPI000DF343EE